MRAYRALLYLYPAAFRHEYGSQMSLMFADQLGEARRAGGRFREASLWLRVALDALTVAPKEHAHVLMQDLRYAFRTMAANPGIALIAILTLALGIGANTAIFSIWNGVLHGSLPVAEPERLVILTDPGASGGWIGLEDGDRPMLTYAEFESLRDGVPGFTMMAAQASLATWNVRFQDGRSEEARGRLVSGGFFDVLGVPPTIGRAFDASYDRAPQSHVVISHDFWMRSFGGRRDVIGTTLGIERGAATIIGVTPRGFIGETSGQRPDLWIPLPLMPALIPSRASWLHDDGLDKYMWLHGFARLKPDVTLERAADQANAVFHAGLESFYGELSAEVRRSALDQRLRVQPGGRGASGVREWIAPLLAGLLTGTGLLLLITCANVANLLLARGMTRRPEIALRLSLGASRGRLVRQMLTESLVWAALGGAAGMGAAYAMHGGLTRMMTIANSDFRMDFSLDPAVLGFALAVTTLAALLAGVLPAWQVTRADAGAVLKDRSRTSSSAGGKMRWGRALVSVQLALSLPLLAVTGLFARTFYNLQRVDVGYSTQGIVQVELDAGGYPPAERQRLHAALRSEFQSIPGVQAVSFSGNGVFSGGRGSMEIEVEGYTRQGESDQGSDTDVVGPAFFSTLGVPMLAGREIQESDGEGRPFVVVINQAFAKQFFEGRNPLGRRVTRVFADHRTDYQVVGVAADIQTENLREKIRPRIHMPAAQPPTAGPGLHFLIRTAGATGPVIAATRAAVQKVDAAMHHSAQTLDEAIAPQTSFDGAQAQLAAVMGGAALLLAAIGLYGVLSYGTARRRGEIAVRMALGARPARVIAMILGETAKVVIAGLVLGAGLAYAASKLVTGGLFGVEPHDPWTLGAACGVLVAVALAAAYLPARRASRLDPMAALRSE